MASYFDDFLDLGDTQPIKVDDLPDAFASLPTLGNLPPDVASNAITSALKGEKEQNTATTPLTSILASTIPGVTDIGEEISKLDPSIRAEIFNAANYENLVAPEFRRTNLFTRGDITEPTFDLDPVRERTKEIAEEQAIQNFIDQASGTFQPINPTTGQPVGPRVPNPVPTPDAPQYTFGMGSMSPPEPSPFEYYGIPALASAIAPIFGGYKEPEYKQVFVPNLTGRLNPYDTLVNGVLGQYVDVPTGVGVPSIGTPPPPGAMEDAAARGSAPRINIEDAFDRARFDASRTGSQFGITGLDTRRVPTISELAAMQPSQVAPVQTQAGITGLDTTPRITPTTDDDGAERIVQTGGATEASLAEEALKELSQDERYKDVFNEDGTVNEEATEERAKAIIDSVTQGQSTTSKVNMKNKINFPKTPTEGRIESFDRNGNLVEGGSSLYIYRNGEWIYRGERGNLAESDADFFARLDDQTEDVPSAPEAPPTWFPRKPYVNYGTPTNLRTATDQFGQPVVQATGQPMQEVMRAPATYGEVLGGTPMQPMTTTGGFYDDLYQQSLEPVDAFMAYQLSQFPGASLGSRLAAQDALGSGFEPAFGRFLLGSASGRITPDFETPDASGGFGRYLRDRQRADLSQVRQEFANLGAALRGYTSGGALDPRFASYYETFGDPSRPESLRNSILNAAQAALGTRRRTGALGNIYDVMQQQYGAGAGSRFADFVSGAFNQQPMMQSFATNTSPYQISGFEQYNPINRLGATTAASARVQPTVQTYQPISGFNTKLTNQLYGPAGIAQG